MCGGVQASEVQSRVFRQCPPANVGWWLQFPRNHHILCAFSYFQQNLLRVKSPVPQWNRMAIIPNKVPVWSVLSHVFGPRPESIEWDQPKEVYQDTTFCSSRRCQLAQDSCQAQRRLCEKRRWSLRLGFRDIFGGFRWQLWWTEHHGYQQTSRKPATMAHKKPYYQESVGIQSLTREKTSKKINISINKLWLRQTHGEPFLGPYHATLPWFFTPFQQPSLPRHFQTARHRLPEVKQLSQRLRERLPRIGALPPSRGCVDGKLFWAHWTDPCFDFRVRKWWD